MREEKDLESDVDDEYICVHNCCDWDQKAQTQKRLYLDSNEALSRCINMRRRRSVPFWGKPNTRFPQGTTYTDVAEMIADREWWMLSVRCTIAHAQHVQDIVNLRWLQQRGFGGNDRSISLLKGYYVICNEVGVHKHNVSQIHCSREFICVPELSEIMPRRVMQFLEKNYHKIYDYGKTKRIQTGNHIKYNIWYELREKVLGTGQWVYINRR